MCLSKNAVISAKKKPKEKVGAIEKCPLEGKIEIKKIEVSVDVTDAKVIMNDPEAKILATAIITYIKNSTAEDALDALPKIRFTFADPGSNNATKLASFKYSTKYLGNRDDTTAIHWSAHNSYASSSPDSFNKTAKVEATPLAGTGTTKKAEAKIWFKPSGVGGDNFKVIASAYKPDGTSKICTDKTPKFTVWRKIDFDKIYTMDTETYIDSGTSVAGVSPAFNTSAYVDYTRGTVNKLASTLSVKYIGLYKSGGGSKNWPTDFSPAKLESTANEFEPTTAELADYGGSDNAKKALAKTKIEAKAQLWFNAIVSDYGDSCDDWFSDAAVPSSDNTLLAVQYYHPKLSGQADGATSFWPSGIKINLANPGSGLTNLGDPDSATWREVQGFNKGSIVVIFKNYGTAARLKIICRHEIGHATKSEFKRKRFGTGDHSSSGLMTPYGGASTFSIADIKILKGLD